MACQARNSKPGPPLSLPSPQPQQSTPSSAPASPFGIGLGPSTPAGSNRRRPAVYRAGRPPLTNPADSRPSTADRHPKPSKAMDDSFLPDPQALDEPCNRSALSSFPSISRRCRAVRPLVKTVGEKLGSYQGRNQVLRSVFPRDPEPRVLTLNRDYFRLVKRLE